MRLINRRPGRSAGVFLALLPFALAILAYVLASNARLEANPGDRLMPAVSDMASTVYEMATVPDRRSGSLLFWADTWASLERLFVGLGISALLGVAIGCLIGFFPYGRALLAPFVSAFSLIPPITILPILFILLGLGEAAKIGLIVVGTAPAMTRALAQAVLDIPDEQLVKAQTLGASSWQIVTRVFLPQIWPALLSALRLGLIPAWIFLVSAEAIAATEGLGYRIFLVRRYLGMDVILPYVAWITLLAYAIDQGLALASRRMFRWAHMGGDAL